MYIYMKKSTLSNPLLVFWPNLRLYQTWISGLILRAELIIKAERFLRLGGKTIKTIRVCHPLRLNPISRCSLILLPVTYLLLGELTVWYFTGCFRLAFGCKVSSLNQVLICFLTEILLEKSQYNQKLSVQLEIRLKKHRLI